MGDIREIAAARPDSGIADKLQELADRARNGEFIAFGFAATVASGDNVTTIWIRDPTVGSHHALVAAVNYLLFRLLQAVVGADE